jgi:branched-chain amino acid transport system permease protein
MLGLVLVYPDIAMDLLVYFIVATSLNFVMGYAKSLSVHHAALFGIGAFTYAVFAGNGWTRDIVLCGLAGAAIAGILSLVLAIGSLRIAGDYFIVASFAFQLFAINLLYNWTAVSGGRDGRYALPSPSLFGLEINTTAAYIGLAGAAAGVTLAFSIWLRSSPYGRLLRAMGESPSALETAGFGVLRLKAGIFGISGMFAAFAGVLYASYLTVAQTATFDVGLAILLAAIVVIGGTGSSVGAFLGAALIALVQPLLSNLNLSPSNVGAFRQLIFAGLLIFVVAALPRGLVQLGEVRKVFTARGRS